jgi:hypothetical protein
VSSGGTFNTFDQGAFTESIASIDAGLSGLLFLRDRIALEGGLGLRYYPEFESSELALSTGVRFFIGGESSSR